MIFKITICTCVFLIFLLKVRCFKQTREHRLFFSKFYVKLGSWGMIFNSDTQAATDLFEPAR